MNDKINVMVNGLGNPGKMSRIIAQGILTQHSGEYTLISSAMTGPNQESRVELDLDREKKFSIELVPPERHEGFLKNCSDIPNKFHAIDFCKGPGVADRNAQMYFENRIPFVMGSTGADYDLIQRLAEETQTPCVAYPNMDIRIVTWMAGIVYMAENYPGAFEGAQIDLSETHQQDKSDTSGTMKKMLVNLGALVRRELTKDDILSIRDPIVQAKILQVPNEWIGWHAYHFIKVYNTHDGVEDSEKLIFKRHGGDCYRRGTMKALDFLIEGKNTKYFNTMIDVVQAE